MSNSNEFFDRDKDGYLLLKRRDKSKNTVKDDKKQSLNPFKKGSWKHFMYKKCKKHKTSKYVIAFHVNKLENFIISRKNKLKVKIFKRLLDMDALEKIGDDSFVLINSRNNMYTKLSMKCYLKLIKIKKISILYQIYGQYDINDKGVELVNELSVIDNINDLMCDINYYRQIESAIHSGEYWSKEFAYVKTKTRIMVLMDNEDDVKIFNSLNSFLDSFHFIPLL